MRRTNLSSASDLGSVVEFDEVHDASGRVTASRHRPVLRLGEVSPRALRLCRVGLPA